MSEVILSLDSVEVELGSNSIIGPISFALERGQHLALVGPNGAGKSTVLKAIAGILPLRSGDIRFKGQSINDISTLSRARLIGYLPQRLEISMDISVWSFVSAGLYPLIGEFGVLADADARVSKALAQFDVNEFAERSLLCLSGGELQRVFLAAAMVHEPEILVLDEPGSFLDPRHYETISESLYSLARRENMTVIAVSHDLNLSALWSNRMAALKSGRLIFDGTATSFMQAENLRNTFDFNPLLITHPAGSLQVLLPRGPL
jgi:iron complex transport system ATP-binding protein